jgi:uncharacterized protein with von Willebrand factor type A (vWA) domain
VLLPNLVVFGRTLRTAGVLVRAGGMADAVRALDIVGVARKADVHDALRAVLVFRREDFAAFDKVFDWFWRTWPEQQGVRPSPMRVPPKARTKIRVLAPGEASDPAAGRDDDLSIDSPIAVRTYSPDSAWRRKDFAAFTPEDLERARAALANLVWDPGSRLTRRWGPGRDGAVDLRRLLRKNAKHGTEPLLIPYRRRRVAPRPLILICDVSGSMDLYTRMLLLFAHAIAGGGRRVEVFVFSTRLTRVTRQFAAASIDAALGRLSATVTDWAGGTRIGEAIHDFNVNWGRRVLTRSPVVLLISDGWDLGDPALLAREIARLQRSVRRLIWLNPLLGSPGYEPLTRGMQAALPHVDDFLPAHNMDSLESLAVHLNRLA